MSSADDQYEQQNDAVTGDAPTGDFQDNDYKMRPGEKGGPVPVQGDDAKVEDPIDPATADSDETLGKLLNILTAVVTEANMSVLCSS